MPSIMLSAHPSVENLLLAWERVKCVLNLIDEPMVWPSEWSTMVLGLPRILT
jgi:hypothetical protein